MRKNYRVINISSRKQMEEYRRRQILNRRIRCACKVVGIVSFICFLGTCGGLEQGISTISQFATYITIEFALIIASFIIHNMAE